ncbi:MAG: ABC transporter permease [Acidobacteria bacterium]|nr:MAG: ABC transporter permease [Acidobacteriota bacterium]
MNKRSPLWEMIICRFREFAREPEVIFWVFGFPVLLAIGLGIAFRDRPPARVFVAVMAHPQAQSIVDQLKKVSTIQPEIVDPQQAATSLRLGKVALVVVPGNSYEYRYDPTRPDSLLVRSMVDAALQKAAGRRDPVQTSEKVITEPGARYIDFLIPGLLGMNLMGGGMWGIGFVIVDMRIKKLLKRMIATPMRKSDFMLAMIVSRLVFMVAEVILLLLFGYFAFGMIIQGSIGSIMAVAFFGSMCFTGMGLLVASRARKIETVSGLMNLVMLPMYVVSGIFFSAERFPTVFQPFIQALPLTALNDALRAVILEGANLASQSLKLAIIAAWGVISFLLALRWFRWN